MAYLEDTEDEDEGSAEQNVVSNEIDEEISIEEYSQRSSEKSLKGRVRRMFKKVWGTIRKIFSDSE